MGIRVPAPWGLVTLPETFLVVKKGFAKERGPLQQVFITTTTMIKEPLLGESGNQWPCRHLPGLPEFSLLSQTSVWQIPERKSYLQKYKLKIRIILATSLFQVQASWDNCQQESLQITELAVNKNSPKLRQGEER